MSIYDFTTHCWNKLGWLSNRLFRVTQSAYLYVRHFYYLLSLTWKEASVFWMQVSIMSLAINLSRCSRWERNSGSGQCRSLMKDCRASSFQNSSSLVEQPFLEERFPHLMKVTPIPNPIKIYGSAESTLSCYCYYLFVNLLWGLYREWFGY